jgi:hypothetical protein
LIGKIRLRRFCACPSLDGTLRVDLRSTKRAPGAFVADTSVDAGKKRGFCRLHINSVAAPHQPIVKLKRCNSCKPWPAHDIERS